MRFRPTAAQILVGLLAFACSAMPHTQHRATIELYEDFEGNVLRTRSIEILPTGKVTEERYDFITGGAVHSRRSLRRLSHSELSEVDALIAGMRDLPSDLALDESTGKITAAFDAPFRAIRFSERGVSRRLSTQDVDEQVPTQQQERFRSVWHRLLSIVDG